MTDESTPTALVAKRDEKGRLLPGQSANPRGKPALPDWFKSKAPEALRYLLEVATGEKGDCPKLRLQAAERVVERFYGKPDASIEVTATTNEALEVLRALAKPREEP
jgi:hypothetical protein